MFFSHFVLAKKGPLARIWLAAHWDKKLTKAHILEINIERSVEGILQPKIKLALRTSGHLLLGVVRIYSRKAKYLLAECNEAFVKIKMAFRPGMVDLPEGNREAALATITLPEVFHDFENIGDITIEVNAATALHQSRAEDITLKEDYGTLSLMGDDGFDIGFDDPEMVRDATNIDEGFDQAGLLIPEETMPINHNETLEDNIDKMNTDSLVKDLAIEALVLKDVEDVVEDADPAPSGLFESGLFEDAPNAPPDLEMSDPILEEAPVPPIIGVPEPEISDDDTYGGPPSVGLPSPPSSPDSTIITPEDRVEVNNVTTNIADVFPEATDDAIQLPISDEVDTRMDEEAFALAPLETIVHKGPERTKSKRKRKLIIDEVKNISGEEMKAQLSDTRDIISTLDLAPPTKRLMHWKESGGVEKLFALPGRSLQSIKLSRLYMRHLTTRPMIDEHFDTDNYPTLEEMKGRECPRENLRSSKRQRRSDPEPPLEVDEPCVTRKSSVAAVEFNENVLNLNEDTTIMSTMEELQQQPQPPEEPPLEETLPPPVENIPEPEPVPTQPDPEPVPEVVPEPPAPVDDAPPAVAPEVAEKTNSEVTEESDKTSKSAESSHAESLFDALSSTSVFRERESDLESKEADKSQEVDEPPEQQQQEEQHCFLDLDDDDDDYHNPASVGAPDEQMYDETYEQFEERVHGKRATHMLHIMRRNLDAGNRIPFSAITRGNFRKQVAQKFYTLLMLKKQQAVELEQSAPYEEIYISKGALLDAVLH